MSQIARRSFIGLSLAALASAALPVRIALAATPARLRSVISADSRALDAAVAEFNQLLDELAFDLPDAFAERLCAAADMFEKFVDLRQDRLTALPAGETRMILEPSEFFNRLLAALRARDWDIGVFVDFHNSGSVGLVGTSNEEQASTESQGSVGACPPKSQGA